MITNGHDQFGLNIELVHNGYELLIVWWRNVSFDAIDDRREYISIAGATRSMFHAQSNCVII